MAKSQGRAHWSSRIGFILAAAGSAIGLGNLWKFPYITGVNGGAAFVLVYLACIAAVGIPIFIAELYIGQTAQKNAVEAFEVAHKKKTPWRMVGFLGVLSAFVILSFYSVVGGWILDFEFRAITNQFAGHSDQEIQGFLGNLFTHPLRQLFWHFVFMAVTVAIILGGVKNGIERWNNILMPSLFGLLLLLLIRSLFMPGFPQALSFLFSPDTSRLTNAGILEAVGHSFFTLSLGMGAMITYGSYLGKGQGLVKTAFIVAIMDTAIALIAGVVIFSIVFSFGLEPGSGPTLMFQTLPVLFAKMDGGYFISVAFFLLVTFAAVTSAVSMLEVIVAYWVETHKKDRIKTTLIAGSLTYVIGILSALSTNVLADFKLFGLTFFDLFDKVSSQVFLPVGGLLISVFFGWILGPRAVAAVIGKGPYSVLLSRGLLWSARIIAPIAVAIMLARGLL